MDLPLRDSALGSLERQGKEMLAGVREVSDFFGPLGGHLSRIFSRGGVKVLKISKRLLRSGEHVLRLEEFLDGRSGLDEKTAG